MKQKTISLSARVIPLIKLRAELSGRTFEDELSHGIMMQFDPEYANLEMQKMIRELMDQNGGSSGEEHGFQGSTIVSAAIMREAIKDKKLSGPMRSFLTSLCKNDGYMNRNEHAQSSNLDPKQISSLFSWITQYLKRSDKRNYSWRNYLEFDDQGRYRLPTHLREVVSEILRTS